MADLPYVDHLDIRAGLPSLVVKLDGIGVPDGPTMALAAHLRASGALPSRRVSVSLRSGALRLCPDDLRIPGAARMAIGDALLEATEKGTR